jgi:hypothetical protein
MGLPGQQFTASGILETHPSLAHQLPNNTQRLYGYLGDIPPAEFEAAFYAGQSGRSPPV